MNAVLKYINSLSVPEQAEFAARCGTSVGYLRKACSKKQRLGESLCINLVREIGHGLTLEELRPDVDWAYVRNSTAQQVISKLVAPDSIAGGV